MTETNLGPELAQLRKGAKISQADIASKMGVDQSSISRLERGDVKPSTEDLQKYLLALDGNPTAKEFAQHMESQWKCIEKPSFRHPYRKKLWLAETTLAELQTFTSAPGTPAHLVQQAKLYENGIRQAAAYLLDLRHNFAFVGNIMVGKTTALCCVADLLIEGPESLKQRVVLETGGGWVTLCEVQVRSMDSSPEQGGKFGLVVYPYSQNEIFRLVSDICASLFAMREGKESESRAPEEIERALRSMAELIRRPAKGPGGVLEDSLLELAETYDTPEELTAEFIARMKLDERTTSDIWFDAPSVQEGLAWLQGEFRKVNNGRNPKVSLPKRIDVFVPRQLLKGSPYETKFIDTKGVDESAVRPDLQIYVDDQRTVTLLCSHFAPDQTMIELLDHLAATGKAGAISERIIFLVLARRDEALAINNEDGTAVDDVHDAYSLREAQIRSRLTRFPGGKNLPILFFDAAEESPGPILEGLEVKLNELRSIQGARLQELASATEDLVTTYEQLQVQMAFAKLREELQQFLALHRQLPPRTMPMHERMLDAFKESHARTVWASARRNGDWVNLDSYHYVGMGANMDAKNRSDPAMTALENLLDKLLEDPDCAAIRNHLVVLKSDVATWRLTFLDQVSRRSQEIFRAVLYPDHRLWNRCLVFWGQGKGFRAKVAKQVQDWLEEEVHTWIQEAVEGITMKDWNDFFIAPVQAQCKEPAPATTTEAMNAGEKTRCTV
jgi:transcriptional regulator with XRE-family HTH domain